MFSFIFLTHGELGETLVKTCEFIMNDKFLERIHIYSMDYSMLSDIDKIRADFSEQVENMLSSGYKVIVFVDIFGGSPSNIAFTFSKRENVDIISGVNLPMLIYAFEHMNDEQDIKKIVDSIISSGSNSIVSAKTLINRSSN